MGVGDERGRMVWSKRRRKEGWEIEWREKQLEQAAFLFVGGEVKTERSGREEEEVVVDEAGG